MKRYVKTARVDTIRDVPVYYDSKTGDFYIYTLSNGRGRLNFESIPAVEEYLDTPEPTPVHRLHRYSLQSRVHVGDRRYDVDMTTTAESFREASNYFKGRIRHDYYANSNDAVLFDNDNIQDLGLVDDDEVD